MPYSPANPFDYLMSGGFRSYNGINVQQNAFAYAFNPYYDNGKGQTGQMQLITTNNQGALRVDVGTGININANITGINVNIPPSTAVTGVVNVTGQVVVTDFNVLLSGINTLNTQVAALTGVIDSKWQKTKSAGYSTVYSAITGNCLISSIQGYSKTSVIPGFVLVFDSATAPAPGATPDMLVATQPNNFFINLPSAGVEFNNGLTIVNSSTPDVYTPVGSADFIANVVYKMV